MNCNVFVAWKDEKSFDQRIINGLGFQPVPGKITCSDEHCNLRHIAKKEVENGETIILKPKHSRDRFIAVFVKWLIKIDQLENYLYFNLKWDGIMEQLEIQNGKLSNSFGRFISVQSACLCKLDQILKLKFHKW